MVPGWQSVGRKIVGLSYVADARSVVLKSSTDFVQKKPKFFLRELYFWKFLGRFALRIAL